MWNAAAAVTLRKTGNGMPAHAGILENRCKENNRERISCSGYTLFVFGINAEIYNMNFLQTLTVNA